MRKLILPLLLMFLIGVFSSCNRNACPTFGTYQTDIERQFERGSNHAGQSSFNLKDAEIPAISNR